MNEKLWRIIQISSISTVIIGGFSVFLSLPREKLPNGGWHTTFPSVTFQIVGATIIGILGFLFVFSTMALREKEVSLKTLKSTIIYIVGFAIFYLFLRAFRD